MEFSIPELTDGVITVRPPSPTDVASYLQAFSDEPELGVLLGIEADPTAASLHGWSTIAPGRAERSSAPLVVADAISDRFLGEIVVHSIDDQNRRGELGFWLVPDARRQGLARRALTLVVGFMFTELDLARVEITTTPDNPAVPPLAERLGFRQEGVLRSRDVERGRRVDIIWFGLLREEWRAPTPGA